MSCTLKGEVMRDYAVVAYATNNMAHDQHLSFWEYADQMESSLMIYGHRAHIVRYPAATSRNDGLVIKGKFVRESLEELRCPVLYIDVDSRLDGPLGELPDGDWDMAVILEATGTRPDIQWRSGVVCPTLFAINYTEAGLMFARIYDWLSQEPYSLVSDASRFRAAYSWMFKPKPQYRTVSLLEAVRSIIINPKRDCRRWELAKMAPLPDEDIPQLGEKFWMPGYRRKWEDKA